MTQNVYSRETAYFLFIYTLCRHTATVDDILTKFQHRLCYYFSVIISANELVKKAADYISDLCIGWRRPEVRNKLNLQRSENALMQNNIVDISANWQKIQPGATIAFDS